MTPELEIKLQSIVVEAARLKDSLKNIKYVLEGIEISDHCEVQTKLNGNYYCLDMKPVKSKLAMLIITEIMNSIEEQYKQLGKELETKLLPSVLKKTSNSLHSP